jgi:hypothetical protein
MTITGINQKYTDQQLITTFSGQTVKGLKRWQVCFYPRTDASVNHDNDKFIYFSAPNRAEAWQMANEYGMRINNCLVRWLYQAP